MRGKIITFYLDDRLFGIDITRVKEINRNVEYNQVPDTSQHIVGLLNLRGQIVTLFSLKNIMGMPDKKECTGLCMILKPPPGDPDQIGFLIDRAGDVADVAPERCEPVPANYSVHEGRFIDEVFKSQETLVPIISPEELVRYLSIEV